MSSYVGRHAQLYDLFYGDKPYVEEAGFIHDQLQLAGVKPGAKLLDLACGTGRHAIEFARLGYEVTGVDYSPDMIARAKAAVAECGRSIKLHEQNMRLLNLGEQQFDVITCLFDSIGYLLTNDAIGDALGRVGSHLATSGVAVIEFWHGAAMLRSYDPVRVRRWATPSGEVLRISETQLDVPRQTSSVSYSIYELRTDGTYNCVRETQQNRYFLVQEMAALLAAASLRPEKWFGGYSAATPISDDTWHVLAFARAADYVKA